ncbi:MAG: hypothetical protein HZB91_04525 [Elusimicrobia bacterium]|nr:hypothetical protein [Elusimicrobiota bacterium]
MNTVQANVLVRMRRNPKKVHISKDFLYLGSRAAVDLALFRLVASNAIQRIGRGLYHIPQTNPRLGIELAPDLDEVAQALARRTGSRIVPSGAVAANSLGLSSQVPAKPVYLTDGRTRTVRLGNTIISLKHAPPKDLPLGSPMSALVFQALRYLGREAIEQETIARLRRRLSSEERRRLLKDAHHITDWVAAVVRKACAVDDDPGGTSHG